MTEAIAPIAPQRRPTLFFLEEIRAFSPVFLGADADMTRIVEHRAAARREGRRYAFVTYILHTAARVLAAHPEANAAIQGRVHPKIARHEAVNGKLTLDRTMGGQRVVLSGVLPDLHTASLDRIQEMVDHYKDGDPEVMPEFAAARALHGMNEKTGRKLFREAFRALERRSRVTGTFAVTSLGHRPVDDFYSVGGTTVTIGVGRIADRPVVRDGAVAVAPVLRFTVTFDHRVIDGAEAADVVGDIVAGLEGFSAGSAAPDTTADMTTDTATDIPAQRQATAA